MKTYMSFNEILKVVLIRKLLNISLKNEISFVVLRSIKNRHLCRFFITYFYHLEINIKSKITLSEYLLFKQEFEGLVLEKYHLHFLTKDGLLQKFYYIGYCHHKILLKF